MPNWRMCRECGTIFDEKDGVGNVKNIEVFCSAKHKRIFEARKGEPSWRDKEARFIDEVMSSFERIFKPPKE